MGGSAVGTWDDARLTRCPHHSVMDSTHDIWPRVAASILARAAYHERLAARWRLLLTLLDQDEDSHGCPVNGSEAGPARLKVSHVD